jgi:hypothetical protein
MLGHVVAYVSNSKASTWVSLRSRVSLDSNKRRKPGGLVSRESISNSYLVSREAVASVTSVGPRSSVISGSAVVTVISRSTVVTVSAD